MLSLFLFLTHFFSLFVCVCASVLKKTCLCNGSDDFICSLPWIVQHFYHYLGVRAFFQVVNLFFDSLSSTYFFLIFQIIRLILHHWSSHKWIDRWMRRTMHNIRSNVIIVGKPPNQKEFYDELWNWKESKLNSYNASGAFYLGLWLCCSVLYCAVLFWFGYSVWLFEWTHRRWKYFTCQGVMCEVGKVSDTSMRIEIIYSKSNCSCLF